MSLFYSKHLLISYCSPPTKNSHKLPSQAANIFHDLAQDFLPFSACASQAAFLISNQTLYFPSPLSFHTSLSFCFLSPLSIKLLLM